MAGPYYLSRPDGSGGIICGCPCAWLGGSPFRITVEDTTNGPLTCTGAGGTGFIIGTSNLLLGDFDVPAGFFSYTIPGGFSYDIFSDVDCTDQTGSGVADVLIAPQCSTTPTSGLKHIIMSAFADLGPVGTYVLFTQSAPVDLGEYMINSNPQIGGKAKITIIT